MKTHTTLLLLCLCFAFTTNAQSYTHGDLSVTPVWTGEHDSLQCHTHGKLVYNITLQNSFMNDSVKVVVLAGVNPVWWSDGNSTGQATWSPVCDFGDYYQLDLAVVNNVTTYLFYPMKVISGPDTVYISENYQVNVPFPCHYDSIRGRVYNDANGNCVFDNNEVGMYTAITVQWNDWLGQGTAIAVNDIAADGSWAGPVQIERLAGYEVWIEPSLSFVYPGSCTPLQYTFGNTLPQANIDFALGCTDSVDLQAYTACRPAVRPLVPFNLAVNAGNQGCTPLNGILQLELPPHVSYYAGQSQQPADSVSGNKLFWHFYGLSVLSNGFAWNSFLNHVRLMADNTVNTGDTLCFVATIPPVPGETDLSNNTITICLPVVNSFDPNVKQVSPGEGAQGVIAASTPWLTYTIHFQNTGSAEAYNIYVTDTLDANLVDSTLQILGSTHAMRPEWTGPGSLKFKFENIMLADSMHNEPESHGSVTYRVRLKPGLSPGTQIHNTASIFFDNNPAVVTNTAVSTIENPNGIARITSAPGLGAYPNPATGKVTITLQHAMDNFSIKVLTLTGETLLSKNNRYGAAVDFDLTDLSTGVYIVELNSNGNTSRTRVVKQ